MSWGRHDRKSSVAFISFAKKVAIAFCQFFSQLLQMLFSLNL